MCTGVGLLKKSTAVRTKRAFDTDLQTRVFQMSVFAASVLDFGRCAVADLVAIFLQRCRIQVLSRPCLSPKKIRMGHEM